MLKKYASLFIFCILSLILYGNAFADGESSTAKQKEKNVASIGGGTDFSNESLFTGDVAFTVPITTIGGINIALNYNSNIHKLVHANNKNAQAGWVGLGWSLNIGTIAADINGTIDVSDDRYFYLSSSGSTELVPISGNVFMLKEYQYWKITRSLDGNGNLTGWTITLDDGTKMRFGNYNKDTDVFLFDTTLTKATRFMLGWDGVVCNPLNNQYSSATFIAYQWDLSDIEDIAGNHTTISYQRIAEVLSVNSVSTTLKYTQESHPLKITDWAGRKVEFVLDNLTSAEYVTPPDKIIQRLFERKYLSKIIIKDANEAVVQQVVFGYSVLDIFNQSASKRYLTSITTQDANNNSLTPTNFDYFTTSGSLGENPGALKSITYPDGGKVEYTYAYQSLSNVDLNSTQTENSFNSDINESLLSGSDFYVVKMADNTLRVYRWGTLGWYVDNTFPITTAVTDYWVRNDYVVAYISTTNDEALIRIAQRKNDDWTNTAITLNNSNYPEYGSCKVITAYNNYFLVAHNLRKYNFDGDWSRRTEDLTIVKLSNNTWDDSYIGNFSLGKQPVDDDVHLIAAAGRDFFALQNSNYEDGQILEDCRLYTRSGSSWDLKFQFKPDPGEWGSHGGHAFNLYAGHDYIITYLGRHDNSYYCRIKMYKWPYNSVNDSLMCYDVESHAGIVTGDNFFVTIGGEQILSSGNQYPILTHTFNGDASSTYPYTITNIGDLFNTTFKHTALALGKDYVSIGWIVGNSGKLGVVKNSSGQWASGTEIEAISNLGSDSYVTPVNNGLTLFTEWYSTGNYHKVRAYKEVNNNWTFNTELDNVTLTSGLYEAHTFTQPGLQSVADVIKPGTIGDIISHGFTEGNTTGGSALFSGSPADYPIATKTVADGMGNSYQTTYTFENGVYDHDLNFAKYNKVTVTPPGNIGKTITYFYNDLGPGQASEFIDAINYHELDGMPYKVKIYKQDDNTNPVSITTNKWGAYAIDEENGVYNKRLLQTINITDGVISETEYEYNNTNGHVSKITEPVEAATELGFGNRETDIIYAFSQPQYQEMLSRNMLAQIYESKITSTGTGIVSVMADGVSLQTDENFFEVPFNQEVDYQVVISGNSFASGYFCIGTTPGGDDIVAKIYVGTSSGSFQANTGVIYYLTAVSNDCSPMEGCKHVNGSITYHLSNDPDAIMSWKRIEYTTNNNYLPFKTSVYDGTNWIGTNTITNHNQNGNVTESYNVDNVYSTVKYGYNNALPIAQVTNSKDGESGYSGLESGWQDWETGGSTIVNTQSHTGSYSAYCTDDFGPTKNFYCSNGISKLKSYILECWFYGTDDRPTATITIEIRQSNGQFIDYAAQEDFQIEHGWQLKSIKVDPGNLYELPEDGYLRVWCGFKGSGREGYVDDVRFFPADAMMTTSTYDPLTLQVTSRTDENNVTTFNDYDSFGRLVQTKNEDGAVLSQTTYYLSRDHNGGNYNPDDPNYVRASSYPNDIGSTPVVTTTYSDGLGRTLQTHTQDGSNDIISAASYDEIGRQNKTYNSYSLSNPNHIYDPNYASHSSGFIETQYYSDPLGRVHWSIPQGSSPSTPDKNIESVYDNATLNGVSCYTTDTKRKPATNSVNWITSRDYKDRLGRVVKSSVLDGTNEIQSSTTLYNMSGLPVQITYPNSLLENLTYDFIGHLKTKTTPDAGTLQYIYDKAGRLRFMLDADGAAATPDNVLYWKYDKLGRVTEKGYLAIDWGDGSTLQNYANTDPDYPPTPDTWRKKFTYDNDGASEYLKGRMYKVETNSDDNADVETEETFAYNKYGFITAKNLTVMEVSTQMQTTLYDYDNLGRVAKITYPSRPENLTLQDDDISGTIPHQYEANNNIDAGPDVTVYSGANATFKAGTSIHLKPGFTASNGSNFRAYTGAFTDGGTPTEVVYTYNQR